MIRLNGLQQLQRRVDELKKKVTTITKEEVARATFEIEAEAKMRAPVNFGDLRQSGLAEILEGGLKGKVSFSADYAGYIEFGTGTKVSVPQGWEDLARKVQKREKGDWNAFKENIQAWMKAKGIDLIYTYPIMLSIYQNGIPAQPYLIPAYRRFAPLFKQRLNSRIKAL
jgi:HK97 gp10 family phage protein